MITKLFPKQRYSFKHSNKRLNIWEGSVRSGKTEVSILRFMKYVANAPPGDLFMVGKTDRSLKRNIINPMQETLGSDMYYSSGKGEIRLWGRLIYTVGANDERAETKIRGSTCAGAYGDELTLWPDSFFRTLLGRMSVSGAKLFGTTNPDNPYHKIKTDYLDRKSELDLTSFHFDLDDNIFLDPVFVNNIKKEYTGLWFKRFIKGLWVLAEGAIYDFFDENKHTVIATHKADYWTVSIDYGTSNPAAFLLFGHSYKGNPRVWAEKEYYYSGRKTGKQKTDSEYSNDLEKFIGKKIKTRYIFVDPSAASFRVQLRRDGFTGLREADNSVLDGIRTVARMLKSGEFVIKKTCPNFIQEMGGYVWDAKAQLRGEDKPMKQSDHCEDACRYDLHTIYGQSVLDIEKLTTL